MSVWRVGITKRGDFDAGDVHTDAALEKHLVAGDCVWLLEAKVSEVLLVPAITHFAARDARYRLRQVRNGDVVQLVVGDGLRHDFASVVVTAADIFAVLAADRVAAVAEPEA